MLYGYLTVMTLNWNFWEITFPTINDVADKFG